MNFGAHGEDCDALVTFCVESQVFQQNLFVEK